MAAVILSKEDIVGRLVAAGNKRSRSVLYADVYIEYAVSSENIERNGLIVNHPRTGNPIENPYLAIRDRALRKLNDLRDVKSECLFIGDKQEV